MENGNEPKKSDLDITGKTAYIQRPFKYKILVLHYKLIHFLMKHFWHWFLGLLGVYSALAGLILIMYQIYLIVNNIIRPSPLDRGVLNHLYMILFCICLFYLGWSLHTMTLHEHYNELANPGQFQKKDEEYHLREAQKKKTKQGKK